MLAKLRSFGRRFWLSAAAIIVAGALFLLALTYRPAISPISPPSRDSFSMASVERGAALARIGDCTTCHTANGGAPFAGGKPLATPFGTLFVTNITPDVKTGIGNWSRDAFRRAMRDGVSRDGKHLYPALPYEHFTHATDGDLDALYAFFMTRRPVSTVQPANRLYPPLGFRPFLAGWKMLFLHKGVWQPTQGESAEWNRGAYLVESFGHCGGCHTPRNLLGGEERSRAYDGGVADGWVAPALNRNSPAVRAWTADRLYTYLRTGIDVNHAAAAGPMGPVTHNLARAPDADVRAIAVYVASLMTRAPGAKVLSAPPIDRAAQAALEQPEGAALFAGACAGCHGPGAPMMQQGRPDLSLGSPLHEDNARDAVQIIIQGLAPPVGAPGPYMPALADNFSDAQIAQIAAYARARFTDKPAWSNLEKAVRKARKEGQQP